MEHVGRVFRRGVFKLIRTLAPLAFRTLIDIVFVSVNHIGAEHHMHLLVILSSRTAEIELDVCKIVGEIFSCEFFREL